MAFDWQKMKRNRLGGIQGQETIHQVEHMAQAGAKMVSPAIHVPGDVVTADISAAPVLVKAGTILRIQIAADTYLAFGNPDQGFTGPVSSTTSPAIKLSASVGWYLVAATDDFVMASVNPTRLELISPETADNSTLA